MFKSNCIVQISVNNITKYDLTAQLLWGFLLVQTLSGILILNDVSINQIKLLSKYYYHERKNSLHQA